MNQQIAFTMIPMDTQTANYGVISVWVNRECAGFCMKTIRAAHAVAASAPTVPEETHLKFIEENSSCSDCSGYHTLFFPTSFP